MRESLGGALLLNLVVIFSSVVIIIFIGILSYSKAYRIKNKIIEIIEKHEIYNSNVADELNLDLANAGYDVSNPTKCDDIRSRLLTERYDETNLRDNENNNYGFNYCVFGWYKEPSDATPMHYVVVTFIRFDIPIIGDVFMIPVYGETKTLNKSYDY